MPRVNEKTRRDLPAHHDLRMALHQEVQRVVAEGGITVRSLAEKTGRSREYLSRILNGRKTPSWHTLTDIAHALGYTVEVKLIPPVKGKAQRQRT